MNAVDIFLVLFFLVNMGVFLAKLYNIMAGAKDSSKYLYGRELVVLTAVVSLFSWLIVMSVFAASSGEAEFLIIQYGLYNSISTALLALNIILTVVELVLILVRDAGKDLYGPVEPKQARPRE